MISTVNEEILNGKLQFLCSDCKYTFGLFFMDMLGYTSDFF